jgi:hypothetical protein
VVLWEHNCATRPWDLLKLKREEGGEKGALRSWQGREAAAEGHPPHRAYQGDERGAFK